MQIFVDGKPSGETPITLRLTVGAHKVTATKDNLRYDSALNVKDEDLQIFTINQRAPSL
jgi:PEGA domain